MDGTVVLEKIVRAIEARANALHERAEEARQDLRTGVVSHEDHHLGLLAHELGELAQEIRGITRS